MTLKRVVKDLIIELQEIPVMKGSEISVSYEIVVIKVVLVSKYYLELLEISVNVDVLLF